MNILKKRNFALFLLLTLLAGALAGCGKSKDTASRTYTTPNVDVSYLDGQTTLDKTIGRANEMANGVQAYYDNGDRYNYIIENQTLQMTHNLSDQILVTSLKNRQGDEYLAQTMDSYVVYDGETYYASQCPTSARVNLPSSSFGASSFSSGRYVGAFFGLFPFTTL